MQALFHALILFLLLTLVAGLWRIRRGPTAADRMLAAQLFGTTATAILLLLAEVSGRPALRDVALVLALLAAITVTAFTRRSRMAASDSGLVSEGATATETAIGVSGDDVEGERRRAEGEAALPEATTGAVGRGAKLAGDRDAR